MVLHRLEYMTIDAKMLKDIVARLQKLERAVFRSGQKSPAVKSAGAYGGATGGLRLLIDRGYFVKKRAFGEIRKALEAKGYHYSPQAVQTPLNTLSSSASGPLVAFAEKGRKMYARRK